MTTINVKIAKVADDVITPIYSTPGSAACDIHAYENKTIPAGGKCMVRTGLFLEVPEGYECQVRPRSGLASKHGVTVMNSPGTVDSDFRGEMCVLLVNTSTTAYRVTLHDRIAQLIFAPVTRAEFSLAAYDELSKTTRGDGGWGSTGT